MTYQIKKWSASFGNDYTLRNRLTPEQLDALYTENYGISRTELNSTFIGGLNRDMRILEVGCNIGNQLLLLQKAGFENLYGIEINSCAILNFKHRTKNINLIQACALNLPFKDDVFDLVFTSGLLIHIHPEDIKQVVTQIYRCSRKYIWGFEYFSEDYKELEYRGEKNLLWKADFPKIYTNVSPDLSLTNLKLLKYLDGANLDVMFLLEKNAKT